MNCNELMSLLRDTLSVDVDCKAIDGETIAFTAPYHHADGDLIEFEISTAQDGLLHISDGGELTSRLFLAGYYVENGSRDEEKLKRALAVTPDVRLFNDELSVECKPTQLFSALASLATSVARAETALRPSAIRQGEQFADTVTRLLVTNRIPFEINHVFDVGLSAPITTQFYVPRPNGASIGYAVPAKDRLPAPALKSRLYDLTRILKHSKQMLLPFLVTPDTARPSLQQRDMIESEYIRVFSVPADDDRFLQFLKAA